MCAPGSRSCSSPPTSTRPTSPAASSRCSGSPPIRRRARRPLALPALGPGRTGGAGLPERAARPRQVAAPGAAARRAMTAAIAVRDLTVSFGAFRALDSLSLEIAYGEIRALIGPNGAGKTTLLDVVSGLTRARASSALLDGQLELTLRLAGRHRPRRGLPEVPEALGLRGADGAGEPRGRRLRPARHHAAGAGGGRPGRHRRPSRRRCWRMARSSGWSSAWCWRRSRACCCWTNPSPGSPTPRPTAPRASSAAC